MTPEEIARNKKLQTVQHKKPRIPDKFDMMEIIEYLYKSAKRPPTESECLRFHMWLQSFQGKPTEKECTDFLILIGIKGDTP
jgi:hypothetical protein